MLELPLSPSTSRVAQLERPQKVVGLLEVGSDGVNLMNQILNTLDSVLAQGIGDDCVVSQWDTGAVDFSVAALVDQVAHGLEVGLAVGDVRLHDLEHLLGGLGEFDEDTIVDLQETEELHHFSGFGGHFVDTTMRREQGAENTL